MGVLLTRACEFNRTLKVDSHAKAGKKIFYPSDLSVNKRLGKGILFPDLTQFLSAFT